MSMEPAEAASTLSAGSACSLLLALTLGLLAQPCGCLILPPVFATHSFFNIWRFSPFLCIAEALYIFARLLAAPWNHTSQADMATQLFLQRLAGSVARTVAEAQLLVERPKIELVVPMTLQMVKLLTIRGAPITQVLGILMALSWIQLEYVHLLFYYRCPHPLEASVASVTDRHPPLAPRSLPRLGKMLVYLQNIGQSLLLFVYVVKDRYLAGVDWWYGRGTVVALLLAPLFLALAQGVGVFALGGFLVLPTRFLVTPFMVRTGYYELERTWLRGGKREWEDIMGLGFWWANLPSILTVVVSGLAVGLGGYVCFYDATGTYKPDWLEWLG